MRSRTKRELFFWTQKLDLSLREIEREVDPRRRYNSIEQCFEEAELRLEQQQQQQQQQQQLLGSQTHTQVGEAGTSTNSGTQLDHKNGLQTETDTDFESTPGLEQLRMFFVPASEVSFPDVKQQSKSLHGGHGWVCMSDYLREIQFNSTDPSTLLHHCLLCSDWLAGVGWLLSLSLCVCVCVSFVVSCAPLFASSSNCVC